MCVFKDQSMGVPCVRLGSSDQQSQLLRWSPRLDELD